MKMAKRRKAQIEFVLFVFVLLIIALLPIWVYLVEGGGFILNPVQFLDLNFIVGALLTLFGYQRGGVKNRIFVIGLFLAAWSQILLFRYEFVVPLER